MEHKISKDLLTKLFSYLVNKPYFEVAFLLQQLQEETKQVLMEQKDSAGAPNNAQEAPKA